MFRKTALTTALTLTLLLSACGGQPASAPSVAPAPSAEPTAVPTPVPEPTPTPYNGPLNPLTGLPLENGSPDHRPVAIMLNNLKQALPQLGVSQADIIYEAPVEGGITRMLAVYQDTSEVGTIGSVRSSRPYYLELALGLDALYLHAGGSVDAYSKIREWGVTALDCVNGPYEGSLFWRDQWRRENLGYEHSVVTDGGTIAELMPTYSYRLDHKDNYTNSLRFNDELTLDGQAAEIVTVPFSYYKTGLFEYDQHQNKYLVSEYGKPYIDGNTGAQVGITNLLILKTRCDLISGDSLGHLEVDLLGGQGWYACGGSFVPIRWEKEAPAGELRYYEEDGTPLTFRSGNSYVCIVPKNSDVSFS